MAAQLMIPDNFDELDLVEMKTATKELKSSRSTIDRAIRAGKILAFKPGAKVFVDLNSGREWLLSSCITPQPQKKRGSPRIR